MISSQEQENLTYESALQELKDISVAIEEEMVSIDDLAEKVKRASFLVQFCQKKLMAAEAEVEQVVKAMRVSDKKNISTSKPEDTAYEF